MGDADWRGGSGSAAVAGVVGGLLEREDELAVVGRLLDRVRDGAGTAVVVEGPAGIGKSALLAAVAADARARGVGVLTARGSEFEAEIAFGVARQLFEPMLRAASAGERRRLLAGVARVGARSLGVEAGEPAVDRFAAVHGLFWLCANRAERGPLLVAVDDVQWADDPSLAWLGYLARRAEDLPLVLVLGLRLGEPGGERAGLGQLVGDRAVRRLSLAPLSAGTVGVIVRGQLDEDADEQFCAVCSELTGGNPLFVLELVAAAREEGLSARDASVPALELIAPAAVGTSVLARLGRLGAEAVALARAVAVLGAGTEVRVAARLTDLDPSVAELAADRLASAQILRPARPLEFFHPLIGAAVLGDIAPGARRIAHRQAATVLASEGQGSLARVAAHLLSCGPAGDRWVVLRLAEAAREALDRGAPGIAAGYLRRALTEPPAEAERAGLLCLLGAAEWRAGEPGAIADLEEALAAAGDDRRTLLAACFLLGVAYSMGDRPSDAIEALERGIAAMGDAQAGEGSTERLDTVEALALSDGAGLALTLEALIVFTGMIDQRTAAGALQRAEHLRGRVDAVTDPPVYLLATLAYYAARANRGDEAQRLAERALACGPYPPPHDISTVLIVALTLVESYEAVQELSEDLLGAARRRGAMQELAAISAYRAWALGDRGALADAEADARWALERAQGIFRMSAASELIFVLIERDDLEAAEDVARRVADPLGSGSITVPRFLIARGRLRGAQGRLEEALEDFLECGERCSRFGLPMLSAAPWRAEAALAQAALGDTAGARRLAGEQLAQARVFGRPRILGMSLRACGLVEGGETGGDLLGEAVHTLERSRSPVELARALADNGGALRRAGHRSEARAQLERALDLAHHCGARRIAKLAREELIAAGAKPRRDAITGRDALTAGELRVARLAAQGLTNREIAQALFITTKTAKAHLSRVYRKLEITRRGQLAGALTDVLDATLEVPSATASIS